MAAREVRMTATNAAPHAAAAEGKIPRSWFLDADGTIRRDLGPRELAEVLRAGTGQLWVDVDSRNRHQHAVLEKVFGFHHLAIEDTLHPESRVKLEEYDGYLFMIVRGVRFEDTTPDPYDLETFNLYFFLGPNYLVTVHGQHAKSIQLVTDVLERSPDVLGRGAQRMLHMIMDMAVDEYFPLLARIDDLVEAFEERVFVQFDRDTLQDILAVKRLILSLRRHLFPQREVFNLLTHRPTALLSPETQIYFRDVYDHVLRINDGLETQRDLISGSMEAYLTQVSNRLGMVTKALSVIATLSVPFVVVSGMWGMNFTDIPLAEHPLGFWIMLAVQLGIGALLVLLLVRREWV
jgi:magnesium transporter